MTNNANIDLNLLKSLKALIEERHVGRAAQRMHVTQSAMSQSLARLRSTFDDPLFVRTAKGLTPTQKTKELSGRLSVVLSEMNELLATPEFEPSQLSRRFRLHTHEFIAATYLSSVLGQLNQEAAGIVIDIEVITPDSYRKLDDGEIDLMIGAGLRASPRFMQQRYLGERIVCLLADNHPALENWVPETLYQYPHIKSSLVEERDDPISAYGKEQGFSPRNIAMYIAPLNLQPAMIRNTQLLAFLPESVAVTGVAHYGLVSRPLPFDLPELSVKGLWHERDQSDPAHSWFRQRIKAAIGK